MLVICFVVFVADRFAKFMFVVNGGEPLWNFPVTQTGTNYLGWNIFTMYYEWIPIVPLKFDNNTIVDHDLYGYL